MALAPTALAGDDPPKRALPDYDGRGEEPTTAGDVLLWVPRIAFSPLYFTSEFILRRPLGALITEAERTDAVGAIVSVMTWDDGDAGMFPTFVFDFGLDAGALPSFGLYHFWNHLIVDAHDLRLRGAYGGEDWAVVAYKSRFYADRETTTRVEIGVNWSHRKDHVFAGIGQGRGDERFISRYGEDRLEFGLGFHRDLGRRGGLDLGAYWSDVTFFEGDCCEDPSIERTAVREGLEIPQALGGAHHFASLRASVAADTRAVRPGDESGLRAEFFGELSYRTDGGKGEGWLQAGGRIGAFWDVYNNRVLGLSLYTALAESFDDTPVPFFDLPQLGGIKPLQAFVAGQIRGESAFAVTLDYHYPIWVWLDGRAFITMGNVFGSELDGLERENFRLSFGMGMTPALRDDIDFELLFALGTDTLGNGADIQTLRIVVGTNSGF
ncbi:MAG: hypothetical protein ACI9MR_003402 [Myxococcota bacterium]|jgi:hypothetical protein